MAWPHRRASSAARRGRGHPCEFPWNDYGPAGEKNPTPQIGNPCLNSEKKKSFRSENPGVIFSWGGRIFFICRGIVFAAKFSWIVLYQSRYTMIQGPARVTIFRIQYAIRFGGHSAKHSFFTIHVVLDVPYNLSI